MKETYDLFAEVNPAYVAFVLYRFVDSFTQQSDGVSHVIRQGERLPHVSLAYLAVPLSLSQRLELSFSSTNITTGFLPWLNRFPEIRIGLQRDIDDARHITSRGLRAALFSRALELGEGGSLCLGTAKHPPKNAKSRMPNRSKQALSRAERLGVWMSQVGGTSAIFSALEVQP